MVLFSGVDQDHFLSYNNSLQIEIVIEILFFVLIHVLFVTITYQYYITKVISTPSNRSFVLPSKSRMNFIILFFTFISILAILDRMKSGTFFFIKDYDAATLEHYFWWYVPILFGYVGGSFYLFGVTPFLAFAAGYYKDRTYIVLYYIVSAIYIFIGIYSGQKEVIFSIIIIFWFYSYYLKKQSGNLMKFEIKLMIPILIFIFFLPNLNYYRLLLANSSSRIGTQNMILALKTKQEADYIFKRIDHLDASYNVIKKTPDIIPFKLGQTYFKVVDAVAIYFPFLRSIYPYNGTINNSFANEYGLIKDSVSGITLPIFVEAYMNFGVPGIILVSLLYGLLLAKITIMVESPLLNIKLVGFILFYVFVIQFNALSFQGVFIAVFRNLVTLLIIYFFLRSNQYDNGVSITR